MSFTNFQKTIVLTSGVLVLSGAIAFVVIAAGWVGPTASPPSDNADAPINEGSAPQTKTGNLTLGNLSLDDVVAATTEGNITDADQIIGWNDLQLWADATNKVKIDLDKWNNGEIEFYTNGTPKIRISNDGSLYILGLSNCSLRVDASGKVECKP